MSNKPATVSLTFNQHATRADIREFMNTLVRSVDSVNRASWDDETGSVETSDGFEVHRYICDNDPKRLVKSSSAKFKS